MRLRAFGYQANPAALEDEAELITDRVADGPMKTKSSSDKSFTAVYIVTRVSSEGYTVKNWLEE